MAPQHQYGKQRFARHDDWTKHTACSGIACNCASARSIGLRKEAWIDPTFPDVVYMTSKTTSAPTASRSPVMSISRPMARIGRPGASIVKLP